MKNYLICIAIVTCQLLLALSANAEIYKWTDKTGKIHFSDNKAVKNAEDITASVSKQNIDASSAEYKKLETIFRKENAADRAYEAQQSLPDPASAAHAQRCIDANQRLAALQGRVKFVDEQGNVVKTSEQEREARANNMRKIIEEQCSH